MAGDAIRLEVSAAIERFRFEEAGLRELLVGPVSRDLVRRGILVQNRAKELARTPPPSQPGQPPSVRTGRLRGSITWRLSVDALSPFVDVGSAVTYACVFGSHLLVTTDRDQRTIGQIAVGDRVLTQAGDFQTVIAKSTFPAVEKPDLVDIEVDWRADRSHKLTLTLDHKILVWRDGRNLWIQAGDLRASDRMYDRTKQPHNKGARTRPWKTCEWCDRRHQGQGRRYCSLSCRNAAWASGLNPHLGMIRSEATRRKLSEGATARKSGRRMNQILSQRGYRTTCEASVEDWLIERGVAYELQVPVGEHVVDFFLPETLEIIEADGAYWHQDQERDIARDAALLRAAPGVTITHIHFYEARFTPPLDPEPLPGVRYVTCNPGPGSYVDPAVFRSSPARIVREWRYGENLKPHANVRALLYDLAVEGVHSFLVGGVIVSNSYVELGTSRMAARPFLLPALSAARVNF